MDQNIFVAQISNTWPRFLAWRMPDGIWRVPVETNLGFCTIHSYCFEQSDGPEANVKMIYAKVPALAAIAAMLASVEAGSKYHSVFMHPQRRIRQPSHSRTGQHSFSIFACSLYAMLVRISTMSMRLNKS